MENLDHTQTQTAKAASKAPLIIIGIFVLALGAAAIMYFANTKPSENSNSNDSAAVKTTKSIPSETAEEKPTTEPTQNVLADETPQPTSASSPTPILMVSPSTKASKYKNGSYTATGKYVSPAGAESVDVKLTLESDVIKSADFTGHATHPTSKNLQQKFSDAYKTAVVGKPIDDVSLTVVGGASLVPKGFMDALTQIKTKAES